MAETLGPYELIDKLGAGGMGAVWRARDTRSGDTFALKVIRGEFADDPGLVKRFEREARVAMRLRHPHIVQTFDAGTDADVHYMTMELVEGETLYDRVKREPLSEQEAREAGFAVASALDLAHRERVIHRDIKSANVLLGADGSIKVADFGIARVLDETQRSYTSTFMGSLPYSAPETFDLIVDERSDLYSLGVVLFEAVMGVTPFVETSPLRYMELHRWEQPRMEEVARRAPTLAPVIARLLEKEPRRRPRSAGDVVAALRDPAPESATVIAPGSADLQPTRIVVPPVPDGVTIGAGPPRQPQPLPGGGPVPPRSRTRTWLLFGAPVAAIVVIAAVAGALAIGGGEDDDPGSDAAARATSAAHATAAAPFLISSAATQTSTATSAARPTATAAGLPQGFSLSGADRLPSSPASDALDSQTYVIGGERQPPRTEIPAERLPFVSGSVTARWYTSDGNFVVGYDQLPGTRPLCLVTWVYDEEDLFEEDFLFVSYAPLSPGACGHFTGQNLASAPSGVYRCGRDDDLYLYLTRIPALPGPVRYGASAQLQHSEDGYAELAIDQGIADPDPLPEVDLSGCTRVES
jgi:serine/threonine-protein kinase